MMLLERIVMERMAILELNGQSEELMEAQIFAAERGISVEEALNTRFVARPHEQLPGLPCHGSAPDS